MTVAGQVSVLSDSPRLSRGGVRLKRLVSSAGAYNGRMRRALSRLLRIAAATLLTVVLAEVALRLFYPAATARFIWPPGLHMTLTPDPAILHGIAGSSRFIVNDAGFRAAPLREGADLRLVAVGGSTTECLYLDQDETWPALLETHLRNRLGGDRVWIGNAGRSGQRTREHVLIIGSLRASVPGLDVVLVMAGLNDLLRRLAEDDLYDPEGLSRPGAAEALMPSAFAIVPPEADVRTAFHRRLALWRVLGGFRRRFMKPDFVQDPAGACVNRWREHRRGAARLRSDLPDLAPALREFDANVGRMAAESAAAGARLVVITQPAVWAVDLVPEVEAHLWMGGVGAFQQAPGHEYYTPAALAEGLERFNDRLRASARERGILLIDLAATLGRDAACFYDDVHFNEEGARRVARIVGEALLEAGAPVAAPR